MNEFRARCNGKDLDAWEIPPCVTGGDTVWLEAKQPCKVDEIGIYVNNVLIFKVFIEKTERKLSRGDGIRLKINAENLISEC